MRLKNQKGFTLIELLIVILILAVISSLALPWYNRYHRQAERAAIISECRSLYRAFVVFFITHDEYPYADVGEYLFDLNTFTPLTDAGDMDWSPLDIDLERFRDKLAGRKAEKFDSPDDMGDNQEIFLILPWAKDPSIKFVVAASDNVIYEDGTSVDGGNWIDGVYISQGGNFLGL